MSRLVTCKDCGGTGVQGVPPNQKVCDQCGGTGQALGDFLGAIADTARDAVLIKVALDDIKDKADDIKEKIDETKDEVDAIWDKVKNL